MLDFGSEGLADMARSLRVKLLDKKVLKTWQKPARHQYQGLPIFPRGSPSLSLATESFRFEREEVRIQSRFIARFTSATKQVPETVNTLCWYLSKSQYL